VRHHDDRRATVEYAREHIHDGIAVGGIEVAGRFIGKD